MSTTRGRALQNPDSELSRKKADSERLRAAEKFMVIGSGEATCKGCGFTYKPELGDSDFPVAKGTLFQVGREGGGGLALGPPQRQQLRAGTSAQGWTSVRGAGQRHGTGTVRAVRAGGRAAIPMGSRGFETPALLALQDLPEDYYCPICGAPKTKFESKVKASQRPAAPARRVAAAPAAGQVPQPPGARCSPAWWLGGSCCGRGGQAEPRRRMLERANVGRAPPPARARALCGSGQAPALPVPWSGSRIDRPHRAAAHCAAAGGGWLCREPAVWPGHQQHDRQPKAAADLR